MSILNVEHLTHGFGDRAIFNDTATTEIYTYDHTLSLHDALPISRRSLGRVSVPMWPINLSVRLRIITLTVRVLNS